MGKAPKNVLTQEDKMKMLIALADLPFVHRRPRSTDYMRDVQLTVLDFHMHAETANKGMSHFAEKVQAQHDIHTHAQLSACLASFPDSPEGNTEASLFLWNNRHWKRMGYLRRLLGFFQSVGVMDQPSLHAWVKTAQFERDFEGKVPGLGLAVFHWLLIRCGVPTVKPDVWVINFAERVTGKRLPDKVLIDLFDELAPVLGEPLVTIDTTVWAFERMGMATKDSPGLRVLFWKQLAMRLGERLREDPAFKEGGWQITLDEPGLLRYQQGGLRMTGLLQLSGEDQPAMTRIELAQGNWRERFALRVSLERDEPFEEGVIDAFASRQDRPKWRLDDGPTRIRTDLDMELVISPAASIDDLTRRVAVLADKITGTWTSLV